MILFFSDPATEGLYHGRQTGRVRRFPPTIIPTALRKLDVLAGAHSLVDLRAPPGNRLRLLKGEWRGYYSIRINDQWRIVFRWEPGNATQVTLIDYHS